MVVQSFVASHDTCQRIKYENINILGLLQPLHILDQSQEYAAMDFFIQLLKCLSYTTILVMVEILSKYAHFMPLTWPYTTQ